ncbi:TraD N-terminal domain-containing protein [Providencia hangzhouensis]
MQVNKRISFWLVNFYLILLPLIFYIKVPLQEIKNGGLYWWLYFTSAGEKALYRVPPLYDVHFDGQLFRFTSANILKDPYMMYAGDIYNSGSLLCGPPCLSAFSPLLFTVFCIV